MVVLQRRVLATSRPAAARAAKVLVNKPGALVAFILPLGIVGEGWQAIGYYQDKVGFLKKGLRRVELGQEEGERLGIGQGKAA